MFKNNQKGFTLVELLGTIILIVILGSVAIPTTSNFIQKGKEQAYNAQIDAIALALRMWGSNNRLLMPENNNDQITLTLLQLKQAKVIAHDVKNPKTSQLFPDDMTMTITKTNNSYTYKVNKDSGTKQIWNDNIARTPTIILVGEPIIYVELNNPYVEKGALASTANGETIKDIAISGSSVNTSYTGTYTITYTAIDPATSLTSSVTRSVIVRDTTPPVLNVPGSTTIAKSVVTFNLMTNVSATDNSGSNVTITTKSNLSLGIPGRYVITYTATDAYGNSVSVNRIITISS